MAQFRAIIQGQRGEASRLGSKSTGLRAVVQSWGGEVAVKMYHDVSTDLDCVRVTLRAHSRAQPGEIELYDGPVSAWRTRKAA